jgi:putative endonuclease
MKTSKTWFVYMLECENGSLYTGLTDDLARRFGAHLKGTARSKYTRSFRPVRVAGSWKVAGSKGNALRIERIIKGLDRKAKRALTEDPESLSGLVVRITGSDTVRWMRD